jgi:hypothetical protein
MVKRQVGGNFLKKAAAAIKSTGLVGKAAAALAPMLGKAASGVVGAEAGSAIGSLGSAGANALKSRGWGKKRNHGPMGGGALKLAGRGQGRTVATGSRRMVWNGSAKHTSGGLTKDKLMLNSRGRIVSVAKHNFGKSKGFDYLKKAGYEPKKGEFKLFSKKS